MCQPDIFNLYEEEVTLNTFIVKMSFTTKAKTCSQLLANSFLKR